MTDHGMLRAQLRGHIERLEAVEITIGIDGHIKVASAEAKGNGLDTSGDSE